MQDRKLPMNFMTNIATARWTDAASWKGLALMLLAG